MRYKAYSSGNGTRAYLQPRSSPIMHWRRFTDRPLGGGDWRIMDSDNRVTSKCKTIAFCQTLACNPIMPPSFAV